MKKTTIDSNKLAAHMMSAVRSGIIRRYPSSREYAAAEFQKIADSIAFIHRQHRDGRMTDEQARLHLDIQKTASRMVLLTLEGLGILAVEDAINQALAAVRATVNKALGFSLIEP